MISIVIPAYCEAEQIPQTLKEVQAAIADWPEPVEIILVDDGSSDDTQAVVAAESQRHKNLKGVRHEVNQGLGAALRTGFQHSQGDIVITLDCDLSFDPQDMQKLKPHVGEFDVVVGAQHGPEGRMENIPLHRVWASKLAFQLDRLVFGGRLPTYSSMFVAYKGDLIRNLKFESNTFAGQCEILVRLVKQKARFKGVMTPLIWRDRQRQSSMNLFKEARNRLSLWWQLNRLRLKA